MKLLRAFILCAVIATLLPSCYFGDNGSVYHRDLTADLYLDAMFSEGEMAIWKKGKAVALVNSTVLEAGWTDEFVIARSHPYPYDVPDIVSGSTIVSGQLANQADTTLFAKRDLVRLNGVWHLRYPQILVRTDSAAVYKVLPTWSIIDVQNGCKVYSTPYIEEFEKKRNELHVPDTLTFFLDLKEL